MTWSLISRLRNLIAPLSFVKSLALVVAAPFFILGPTSICANAQAMISKLSTSHGTLVSRPGIGKECEQYSVTCEIITLNGKKLFSDYQASILAVYPSQSNPLLVTVETRTGGNACCQDDYILDFTTPSLVIIKGYGFGTDIFTSEGGIIFNQYGDYDDLGDITRGLFRYVFGSGRPELLRKVPIYSHTPLSQKRLPDEVLSDPILRAPLLRAVGKSHFADFRRSMGVSSYDELKIIADRFIVGSGCMPHNCISRRAMFVIDQIRNVAWALEYSESEFTTLWGVLQTEDTVPIRIIGTWLQANKLSWDRVTAFPLPPDVYQAYASSQVAEPRQKTNSYTDISGKTISSI